MKDHFGWLKYINTMECGTFFGFFDVVIPLSHGKIWDDCAAGFLTCLSLGCKKPTRRSAGFISAVWCGHFFIAEQRSWTVVERIPHMFVTGLLLFRLQYTNATDWETFSVGWNTPTRRNADRFQLNKYTNVTVCRTFLDLLVWSLFCHAEKESKGERRRVPGMYITSP